MGALEHRTMKKQAKPGHVERTRKEIKAVQRRWKMVADEVSRVERSRRCGEALPRRAYRIANVDYVAARNAANASFAAMSRATCFCGPVPVPMASPLTVPDSECRHNDGTKKKLTFAYRGPHRRVRWPFTPL